VKAPDGSELTPQEWDAVRRLRGEPEAQAEAEPVEAEPVAVVETAPASHAPTGRAPALLLPAMVSLVVLAVVAVALLCVVTARLSDRHGPRSDTTAALAAATDGVATVLSYNYKSLDADFAKAESLLTPSFRKNYDATTAKGVQPLAAKYHAVSTAQVTAAGVMSQSGSHVQVVVFVSQQVTNTQLSAPRLDRSRIIVDLQKSGSRWLINNLQPV
jgi:Mce-associated membrane protein